MKLLLPLAFIAAAVLAAVGWLRPGSQASATTAAWETPPPDARAAGPRASAPPQAVVYVAGEVVRPGLYTLPAQARIGEAVARAGGMRPTADPAGVNLAAHLHDGDEIVVPERGAAAAAPHGRRHRTRGPHRRAHRGGSHNDATPAATVDLNEADAAALATIPGVGPGMAERIVAFRAANGRFDSPDELLDVEGITDRRLESMMPYVTVR